MINNKTVLAFIPARGRSKGLPNKNILDLNGNPLIAYTIIAAKKSGICDEIMVSTDSQEIAHVSKKYGASIPFIRPSTLARDNSQMMDVIMHTIKWYENINKKYDIFLYLQPTSPLRTSQQIIEAMNIFNEKNADAVISVNKAKSIPQRMNILTDSFCMRDFVKRDTMYKNRQELKQYYEVNGAIGIANWYILKNEKNWYVKKSYAYIMDDPHCIDIDTLLDFDFVSFLMKKYGININV